jgi:hypothetical protein
VEPYGTQAKGGNMNNMIKDIMQDIIKWSVIIVILTISCFIICPKTDLIQFIVAISTAVLALVTTIYTFLIYKTLKFAKGQLVESEKYRKASVLKDIYDRIANVAEDRMIVYMHKEELIGPKEQTVRIGLDGEDEYMQLNQATMLLSGLKTNTVLYPAILNVADCYQYMGFLIENKFVDEEIVLKEVAESIISVYELIGFVNVLVRITTEEKAYKSLFENMQ